MSRYFVGSFRKRRTASGIGESPASQRRIVLSSLSRISEAKRRADRPDASIRSASRFPKRQLTFRFADSRPRQLRFVGERTSHFTSDNLTQ